MVAEMLNTGPIVNMERLGKMKFLWPDESLLQKIIYEGLLFTPLIKTFQDE